MRLVELVAEGIPGLPPRARLELGAGHVLLPAGSPLAPLFLDLLYPQRAPAWQLPEAGDCRAALTLRLSDGATFRIVRDFRRGVALQRWDPQAQAYAALPVQLQEGNSVVPGASLPDRTHFQAFFTLARGALPSSRPTPAAAAAPPPADPQRLQKLQAELANSLEVEELQRRADALTQESYVVADRLQRLAQAQAELEEARAAMSRFRGDELPEDPGEPMRAYQAALATREEAEARIRAEGDELEQRRQGLGPNRSLGQELARLLPLCLLGLAAMAAGLFSPWRPLAFLAIPLFGVPAWLAVASLGQRRDGESMGRKELLLEERRRKVEAVWESESRPMRELVARLKLAGPQELPKWLERRAEASARLGVKERAFGEISADPQVLAAKQAQAGLKREIESVDDRLASLVAGSFRPAQLIREEIARLQSPAPAAPAAPADPTERFLDRAQALLGADRAALQERLAPKASALFAALSGQRWTAVSWGAAGGVRCAGGAGESEWSGLEAQDRDRLWVALLFAVIEARAETAPLPILLDEPFASFGDAERVALARALGVMAQRSQVLHCTGLPEMRGQGAAP